MTAEAQTEVRLEPSWLSYRQAQQLSGLGRTTLWKLVSSGDIKAARVGRAVRLSRSSVEEYMERTAAEGLAAR
jgi:excisionase family DNA binding protein